MSHKTIEELNKIAEEELAKIQGKELTNKDRMAIPQQEMPSREPKERARQMAEVALGYTEAQAVVEANRCLQCKNMPYKRMSSRRKNSAVYCKNCPERF